MTANKEMISSFLKNSRSLSLSTDKRTRTIVWDCTPGKVFYNYVIPGGNTQRKGYYNHEGIYRYDNGSYKKAGKRYSMFEGVKCTKIQYRKNGGSWSTISSTKGIASSDLKRTFTSTKNGDKFEIKATYQVWTMGSPFRNVPFMWFGTLNGYYNEGSNKFSQSSPANPGRGWSGMSNYEKNKNGGSDKNSSWKISNYSWYQPNSTSKNTNWTYLHAKDLYERKKTSKNGWLSTYACEKWLNGMPYKDSLNDGWTGNVTGAKPQQTRKSSWWTFEKTFTDTYTVSGVTEKPAALSNPTVTLKVINNLTTKDKSGVLNGIAGDVQLTYKQSNGMSGTYKLYACQQTTNNELVYNVVSSGSINNNQTKTITVKFTDFSYLKRSKNIVYYATVETPDTEYKTTRTGKSSSSIAWDKLWNNGYHYYNDEPPCSSYFGSDNNNHGISLSWRACTDPDGHDVEYAIFVCRDNNKYQSSGYQNITVNGYNKKIYYHYMFNVKDTSYTIGTDWLDIGENVDIYLMPHDKYYNDYYYANSLNETTGPDAEVTLSVVDNMTNRDSSGVLSGEHGTLTYKYTHREGLWANIDIYAYIGNNDFDKNSGGYYACKVYTENYVASNTTKTITIDFNSYSELLRGRYIKYFAVATDSNYGTSLMPYSYDSASMWNEATGYHYFNSVPTAVSPFIVEDSATMFDDDYVDLAWAEATDLENHTIFYKMYIQVENDTPYTETFYFNSTDNPQTVKYTKSIELGSATLPTEYSPYSLLIKDYIGKNVAIWIKTYDSYNSEKYLSGNMLDLRNPGVSPDVPTIELNYAYAKNLYGEDKVDSENGYVAVSYSHPAGRNGSVYLHAICKKPNGDMQAFKDIAEFQLSSGGWSSDVKLNFPKIFGNEWRTSEIRYYATAKTYMGEWSEPEGINWQPNTSMWDTWIGTHKFNEEPGDITAKVDNSKCNLHDNIYIDWTTSVDPDDYTSSPTYAVVLAVESDLRANLAFVQGTDGTNVNRLISYTEMWDTPNTSVDIDISSWEDEENFTIYIIPHDDYANSYYYMADPIKIGKIKYGKPKLTIELEQNHSEYGYIKIKYEHEDLTLNSNGEYVSNDPEHRDPAKDFDGLVNIYCFIDDEYTYNYSISDEAFRPGEEKTIKIDFDLVSPYSRSHEIRYYIVATDKLTGVKNNETDPENAIQKDLTSDFHYYNDEPFDPEIGVGPLLSEEDKQIYGFTYVDIVWDTPYEPDDDDCMYYLYLNTPKGLGESIRTVEVTNRDGELTTFDYTRKYRITETYNADKEIYGCKVDYLNNNNEYVEMQSNPFIGIRIHYDSDHLSKEWAENEDYSILVEARDIRTNLENSYYGVSNIFKSSRKRHEAPYEVEISVTYNLTDGIGDGEHGTMTVKYTHPEEGMEASVTIYAYQDNKVVTDVYTGTFYNGETRTIEHDFRQSTKLKRSKGITYYAVATDKLVGMTSLDRVFKAKDGAPELSNEVKLQYIPYLIPDEDGKYGVYDININGIMYDYNVNNHYEGPVQKGLHYFNEEPPSTTPELYNKKLISYKSAEIKWPHVIDPDGHDVSYEIYVAGTDADERMNTNVADFYNDDLVNPNNTLIEQEAEIDGIKTTVENTIVSASGTLRYNKMVTIPASLAQQASEHFSLSTEEYSEDTTINIWIVSKDQYTNSYYRAGNILSLNKGHDAKDIREMYPRNGSTVYAQCPRILIYLGEDTQVQTTYVGWRDKEYNNKDNPELFSNIPNNNNVILFKPPTPYTNLSGTKVSYYAYTYNQCSYSEKKYATYTYKDFFDTFTDKKLIAIKSDHINAFRKAINITRDAYGLLTAEYTRSIQKNMIFENFDFNETKNAICEVNDLLNDADNSEDLDYKNPLIVDINDLDIVEYEGLIGATSYNEFLEWARLVYILQNL